MKKIRTHIQASALPIVINTILLLICLQVTQSYAAEKQKPVDPLDTYVLAVGSCPPWQSIKVTCGNDVELFTDTVMETMGVPARNIRAVLDSEATYEGVVKGFEWLAEKSSESSAVIVYYNGHGMLVQDLNGDGKKEEVFLLWSEKFPFAGLYAVMAKIWMTDLEFARLLAEVPGRAKLVVADTCHAEDTDEYLNGGHGKVDYGLGEEALLAAAEAGQLAYASGDYSLFTLNLTAAMHESSALPEAFEKARKKTATDSRKLCGEMKSGSKHRCEEQGPTIEDPHNVVPLFELGVDRAVDGGG